MRALLIGLAVIVLSSCSIYRPISVEGKSIALDAQQRAILSGKRGTKTENNVPQETVWCAEPSPDAITAIGASSGGAFRSEEQQAQLALTLAQQAASIGLRTQSIQLLRDAMYRACEGYLSGAIGKPDFYQLQRRFQNLTLGLLAIEQLTGAVKADQATLTTGGAAGTGTDDTTKQEDALKKAQDELVTATSEYNDAHTEYEKQKKVVEGARSEATKAHTKAGEKDASDELKSAAAEADKTVTKAEEEAAAKKTLEQAKAQRLQFAQQNLARAEGDLDAARAKVRSSASGAAFVQSLATSREKVTQQTATTVKEIVQIVLNESGRGEECNNVIDDYRTSKTEYAKEPGRTVLMTCLNQKLADAAIKAKAAGIQLQNVVPAK